MNRLDKIASHNSFNTQPPEGGWAFQTTNNDLMNRFNTQPPEGGWNIHRVNI